MEEILSVLSAAHKLIDNDFYIKKQEYTPNYGKISNTIEVNTKIHTKYNTNFCDKFSVDFEINDKIETIDVDLGDFYPIHVIYFELIYSINMQHIDSSYSTKISKILKNIIIDNCGNIYEHLSFQCNVCKSSCKILDFTKNGTNLKNKISTKKLCNKSVDIIKQIYFKPLESYNASKICHEKNYNVKFKDVVILQGSYRFDYLGIHFTNPISFDRLHNLDIYVIINEFIEKLKLDSDKDIIPAINLLKHIEVSIDNDKIIKQLRDDNYKLNNICELLSNNLDELIHESVEKIIAEKDREILHLKALIEEFRNPPPYSN